MTRSVLIAATLTAAAVFVTIQTPGYVNAAVDRLNADPISKPVNLPVSAPTNAAAFLQSARVGPTVAEIKFQTNNPPRTGFGQVPNLYDTVKLGEAAPFETAALVDAEATKTRETGTIIPIPSYRPAFRPPGPPSNVALLKAPSPKKQRAASVGNSRKLVRKPAFNASAKRRPAAANPLRRSANQTIKLRKAWLIGVYR